MFVIIYSCIIFINTSFIASRLRFLCPSCHDSHEFILHTLILFPPSSHLPPIDSLSLQRFSISFSLSTIRCLCMSHSSNNITNALLSTRRYWFDYCYWCVLKPSLFSLIHCFKLQSKYFSIHTFIRNWHFLLDKMGWEYGRVLFFGLLFVHSCIHSFTLRMKHDTFSCHFSE